MPADFRAISPYWGTDIEGRATGAISTIALRGQRANVTGLGGLGAHRKYIGLRIFHRMRHLRISSTPFDSLDMRSALERTTNADLKKLPYTWIGAEFLHMLPDNCGMGPGSASWVRMLISDIKPLMCLKVDFTVPWLR